MINRSRTRRCGALIAALALVVAACGDDDDAAENDEPTPTEGSSNADADAADDDGDDGDDGDDAGAGGDTDEGGATTDPPAEADAEIDGTITIIVPANAGGGFDIAARSLQPAIAETAGNDVVVQNLPGAGGAIGAERLFSEDADGTTMMIVSRSISALPYTGTPEIDPVTDMAPVGVTHQDVAALTVRADAEYQTIDEFLAYAAENPGEILIGTSGTGGVWHAAGLTLAREAGVEFSFIQYDGGSAAGNALIAGEIDAVTIGAPETRPFIESGDAVMLGVMGAERSALYPDVPTFQESGVDVEYVVWRGYVVDSETPDDVRLALSELVEEAAASETNQTAMANAGFETTWIGPDEFGMLISDEDEQFRELFGGEAFVVSEPERVAGS